MPQVTGHHQLEVSKPSPLAQSTGSQEREDCRELGLLSSLTEERVSMIENLYLDTRVAMMRNCQTCHPTCMFHDPPVRKWKWMPVCLMKQAVECLINCDLSSGLAPEPEKERTKCDPSVWGKREQCGPQHSWNYGVPPPMVPLTIREPC